MKLIHHNARRSWSQMYGDCRGECDECLHKTPELRQAANRCVHQLIELSRTPTRDRNVEAQVRQGFFEVKSVRPHTVDLTDEYGAPVIAKRESREIVAGAATPTAAPATPAATPAAPGAPTPPVGSTAKSSGVALRPASAGPRPTGKAPPPLPPPAPPRTSRATSARSISPDRPGSARDTVESRRREDALLETMRRMQDQIDDLRDRDRRSRRSRTRSRSEVRRRYVRRSRSDSRRPRRRRDSRSRTRERTTTSRRGRSRERGRIMPKTPPILPPRNGIRSASTGRDESASVTTWQRWEQHSGSSLPRREFGPLTGGSP